MVENGRASKTVMRAGRTIDTEAPLFTVPPFFAAASAAGFDDVSLDLSFQLSEPGTVHYTVTPRLVTSPLRGYQLGMHMPTLSADAVQAAPQRDGLDEGIMASGTVVVPEGGANVVVTLRPTCVSPLACLLAEDALSPGTEYLVRSLPMGVPWCENGQLMQRLTICQPFAWT